MLRNAKVETFNTGFIMAYAPMVTLLLKKANVRNVATFLVNVRNVLR